MAGTEIYYYINARGENPVLEFILSLESQGQAKVRRLFLTIEKYGLDTIIPHLKKLTGTPLWEIRIVGKDSIRILYVVSDKNSILVLHGFVKKTQKTPEKEIAIALNRYQNLLCPSWHWYLLRYN